MTAAGLRLFSASRRTTVDDTLCGPAFGNVPRGRKGDLPFASILGPDGRGARSLRRRRLLDWRSIGDAGRGQVAPDPVVQGMDVPVVCRPCIRRPRRFSPCHRKHAGASDWCHLRLRHRGHRHPSQAHHSIGDNPSPWPKGYFPQSCSRGRANAGSPPNWATPQLSEPDSRGPVFGNGPRRECHRDGRFGPGLPALALRHEAKASTAVRRALPRVDASCLLGWPFDAVAFQPRTGPGSSAGANPASGRSAARAEGSRPQRSRASCGQDRSRLVRAGGPDGARGCCRLVVPQPPCSRNPYRRAVRADGLAP